MTLLHAPTLDDILVPRHEPNRPHEHKDPTILRTIIAGLSLVSGILSRMQDPFVGAVFWAPEKMRGVFPKTGAATWTSNE